MCTAADCGNQLTQTNRKKTELHSAVVLTLSPTGLSIARSLAPRGVHVYGVDSVRYEIGHFSRWIRNDRRFSYLPAGSELLDALIRFGSAQRLKPVIFLAGDPYIDFVAQNRERLEEHYIMPASMCTEVSSVFLHKESFYTRCRELNIDIPATFFPKTEAEAVDASRKLRYPAIVKPALGHAVRKRLRGRKLVEVGNADETIVWWRRLRNSGDSPVLQELIEGPESNITVAGLYMDSVLQCRSVFTATKNRQYPPMYGSGSYMESKWLPRIAELSIDASRRLGYTGVCGTEYKWDPRDGRWKLIEINCRPTLWFALTRAAGVDVIWDAYCDLVGKPNPVHIGTQNETVRWQLLVRDIVSALRLLKSGQLTKREFLRTVIDPHKKEYAIISLHDVKATLAYPLDTFLKYWAHYVAVRDHLSPLDRLSQDAAKATSIVGSTNSAAQKRSIETAATIGPHDSANSVASQRAAISERSAILQCP